MRDRLAQWVPTRRGITENAIANAIWSGVGTGIGMTVSALLTWIAAPQTPREGVVWFLGCLLSVSAAFAMMAFAWRKLYPAPPLTPRATEAAPVARPQPQSTAPAPRTRDPGEIGRELEALDIVVKFLDREITAAVAECRRLLAYYMGIFKHRERIPAFVRELESFRDTLRTYVVRLEQTTQENRRYPEVASATDGAPCSALVSRVDNFVREIIYAADSLPEQMKADDRLRYVSSSYSHVGTELETFIRWRNTSHKALIERHRKLTA